MTRLREWLSVRLMLLGTRVAPRPKGPLCPDCNYAPDPGPDGECSECAARWEQQQHEAAIYDEGYADGWREVFE